MFNLFDGTGTPKHMYNEWTGIKLIEEEPNESEQAFQDESACLMPTYRQHFAVGHIPTL